MYFIICIFDHVGHMYAKVHAKACVTMNIPIVQSVTYVPVCALISVFIDVGGISACKF
jgi:hypothetical protein